MADRPGDVAGAVKVLREIAALPEAALHECGARARQALAGELSQERLVSQLCDLIEGEIAPRVPA